MNWDNVERIEILEEPLYFEVTAFFRRSGYRLAVFGARAEAEAYLDYLCPSLPFPTKKQLLGDSAKKEGK